jgi:hypothetical protein
VKIAILYSSCSGLYRKIGRRKVFQYNGFHSLKHPLANLYASAPAFKEKISIVTVVKNESYSGKHA